MYTSKTFGNSEPRIATWYSH